MRTPFFLALALSTALATPAHAQYAAPQYPAQTFQTSPADELATVLKRLAASPNDLYALISAGELSVKLDDMSAAAAFFARADKIDPRNGRVKAGMGSILVRAERPGEALRYFQMAESYGLPVSRFASDRGLAYDLLGEQERAQRDYRLALATGRDDETIRRYALSLGIVGRQAQALEQLEPLNRRQDRAAWRARAFVLAMNGDVPGASRIAATMMPGVGTGLLPFFQRLPSLGSTDRAFAVHFGELRPTPARLADARLKPALPVLGPDPFAPPVQVAAAQTTQPAATRARTDRRDRARPERQRERRVGLASFQRAGSLVPPSRRVAPGEAAPARSEPVRTASASPARPVPQPGFSTPPTAVAAAPVARPTLGAPAAAPRPITPAPVQVATPAATSPRLAPATPAPVQVATAAPAQTPRPAPTTAAPVSAPRQPTPAVAAPVQVAAATVPPAAVRPAPITPAPVQAAPAASPPPVQVAAAPTPAPAAASSAPATPPVAQPIAVAAASPPVAPVAAPVAGPPNEAVTLAALPPSTVATPAAASSAPVEVAAAMPAPTPAARSEESILARIVASISIPGEELGITGPELPEPAPAVAAAPAPTPPPAAAPAPPPQQVAAAKAKVARDEADRTAAARTIARRETAAAREEKTPARKGRGERVELAAAATAKGRKPAVEERAASAKGKKPETEERAVAGKRGAKKEPVEAERIWVQVAGGANEDDLPKAWAAAQKKAAALKGRQGYATPLRATNRVVTGPFKTEAEARALINQLARQGVSAFSFTSDKGQKLTKLPAK